MKRGTALLAAFLLVLGTAGAARAGTKKGDKELAFGGALTSTTDEATKATQSQANVTLGIGYFFTDTLEFGYGLTAASSENKDANDKVVAQTTFTFHDLFLNYYVFTSDDETLAVYFGPRLGVALLRSNLQAIKVTGHGSTVAARAGAKYFVSENTSFFGEMEVRSTSYTVEIDSPIGKFTYGRTQSSSGLFFGLSYFFGAG